MLAVLSMGHVGSPDTFFVGKAGPYDVRVSVRLPGVIPGRAQVAVHVGGATSAVPYRVTVQAGQWNVGLKGAPPPDTASPVPGDPTLFATELWLMTATSYELAVAVAGPSGPGRVMIPVLALATAQRPMAPWLGMVLGALGVFLTVGLLTIVGVAVRESVLPPGAQPDALRQRHGRVGVTIAIILAALSLWGGNRWWAAEASSYGRFVLYRPFATELAMGNGKLTLTINDSRWTGAPAPNSRYNALLPDHGKLMHMFLVREESLEAFAHVHPIARSAETMKFDADLPRLPAGRYRVYADIVHESGYAQTLVGSVDVQGGDGGTSTSADPDDSWFEGRAVPGSASAAFEFSDGARLVWERGDPPLVAGGERMLNFSVRDARGGLATVEPYMGMALHVVVVNRDGSVFAHLHPSGNVSMAALEKFAGEAVAVPHAGHAMPLDSDVAIPYAFPKAGAYRIWVQVKRNGQVQTAAFDTTVQ
jgi:hypothetical protein